MVGSTDVYHLPNACRGMSLLVGIVGIAIDDMDEMDPIDHAFNFVAELLEASPLLLLDALPGEEKKPPKLALFLSVSGDRYVLLNFRRKLPAAEAKTIASCALM